MAIRPNAGRVLTTPRESALAREVLSHLEGPTGNLTVERDGAPRGPLPAEIGRILQDVLDVMARGGTVTIGSVPPELTTSAAAGILGVSRPTLMKMIHEGQIAAYKVGTHHRLLADDVFEALRARRQRERAAFAELIELEGDES